jgi:GTPase SAR1 family protein
MLMSLLFQHNQTQTHAGQERFGHMTRVYYKEAVGAMVVFDVTRTVTFEGVQKWKTDIDLNLSTPQRALPCVLLANKCDLAKESLDKEKMDAYIAEHGFIAWFETSAKEDIGIKKAFNTMVSHILSNDPDVQQLENKTTGAFKLGAPSAKSTAKPATKSCCS